jgi:hypothetical protein
MERLIAHACGHHQTRERRLAALLPEQGCAQHADEAVCREECQRSPRLAARRAWLGRTDMGGSDATLSIEESIPLVVDMIEANRGKPGLRYLDRFNKNLP